MAPVFQPRLLAGRRTLAPVPWRRDGCVSLSVSAAPDVPAFEDPMLRDALVRASLVCDRLEALERALNRELWRIGYVARIEYDPANHSVAYVDIVSGR
jgi:hypothetical protein